MLADYDDFSWLPHNDFRTAGGVTSLINQAELDENSGTASLSTALIVLRSSAAIA